MLGEQVLHHVRRLRALIDGQALLAGIPVGDDGARLVGDAGVAAEHERGLDHGVGLGEALVGIAGGVHALEAEIVADRRMDHRRLRIERGLRIGDRPAVPRSRPRPVRSRPRPRRGVRATTAQTASPAQQARSTAMACCGADLRPLRCVSTPTQGVMTLASSAPVTTAITPGAFFAAAASIALDAARARAASARRRHAPCAAARRR